MDENKGLLLPGHVTKLETNTGSKLEENSESGLEKVLAKYPDAVFGIIDDEIRNIPAGGKIQMAEMEYAENPNSAKTQQYKQESAEVLERVQRWIPIAEYFLKLNTEATPGRQKLEAILAKYKGSLESWKKRLASLSG